MDKWAKQWLRMCVIILGIFDSVLYKKKTKKNSASVMSKFYLSAENVHHDGWFFLFLSQMFLPDPDSVSR